MGILKNIQQVRRIHWEQERDILYPPLDPKNPGCQKCGRIWTKIPFIGVHPLGIENKMTKLEKKFTCVPHLVQTGTAQWVRALCTHCWDEIEAVYGKDANLFSIDYYEPVYRTKVPGTDYDTKEWGEALAGVLDDGIGHKPWMKTTPTSPTHAWNTTCSCPHCQQTTQQLAADREKARALERNPPPVPDNFIHEVLRDLREEIEDVR